MLICFSLPFASLFLYEIGSDFDILEVLLDTFWLSISSHYIPLNFSQLLAVFSSGHFSKILLVIFVLLGPFSDDLF